MRVVPATPEAIADAARFLRQGGLVAFPTETVYGLGADATNDLAVAAVFSTKGRPTFNPLIMHVPGLAVAERFGRFDARAKALVQAFWPGPLTLVVPRAADCPVSHLATAGLQSIALRCPAHPVALQLIADARAPIAAPSANRSGHVSPTTAAHVEADLGPLLDVILDGGPCEVGLESTIVDATGDVVTILRPGAVTAADLEAVIGVPVRQDIEAKRAADKPSAPGQLESHYAPRAAVRMNANAPRIGEALLSFGPIGPTHGPHRSLSTRGDLLEAAANLFAALRDLDALGVGSIAVMPIPDVGLGLAINDRLRRAAAPRT
jgi:L-threonylcarbamoyladenylate synthase